MRGGAALHGRKGGGAMPRGKRAYRVLLWAVLAALLALAAFAGWRLWRVYGDAARAAQLAREMQQTAVPAAGESAADFAASARNAPKDTARLLDKFSAAQRCTERELKELILRAMDAFST